MTTPWPFVDVVELHGHGGGCKHRADNMVFKFGKNMPEAGCRLELHVCLFAVLFEISNDAFLFLEFARFNLKKKYFEKTDFMEV